MSAPEHASVVSWEGAGVLLTGPAGSGKSSLSLSLMDGHGAMLVGDDRIVLSARNGNVYAAPHKNLRGLIEMRGLGVLRVPYEATARLSLWVELVSPDQEPRLASAEMKPILGAELPLLRLNGYNPHTPLKIKLALKALKDGFASDAVYPI